MLVNELLINIDIACDYIPVVSTISNLVDLFQKTVTIPEPRNGVLDYPYYTYLREKENFRCLMLLVPVLGNIFIIICDLISPFEQGDSQLDLASKLEQVDLQDKGIMLAECTGFSRVLDNIKNANTCIRRLIKETNDQIKDNKMIIKKPICLDSKKRIQNAQSHIQELITKKEALKNLKNSTEKKEYILSIYLNQIRRTINQPEYHNVRAELNTYIDRIEAIGHLACQDDIPLETADAIERLQTILEDVNEWKDFFNAIKDFKDEEQGR